MTETQGEERITGVFNVSFDKLREVVNLGNRRVAAFLRFALDDLEARDGGDFRLDARSFGYSYWPKEVTKEQRDEAREEFRAWLIGACFRELDLFYSKFLDEVWFWIEVGELHGQEVPSNHVFDPRFSRQTNVARKQRDVAAKLNTHDYYDELNSLSLARNSLSHNAGYVRAPTDCNNAGRDTLTVKWFGYDMLAMREGHELVVERMPFDSNSLPGEGEVALALRKTARELVVPPRNQIRFTNSEIAEMCWFYRQICDETLEAYQAFLVERGIPMDNTATPIEPSA